MANRYFKGSGQITIDIEKVIVGNRETQMQPSKLGNRIVKLQEGDKENHDCLKNWTELSYEEMIADLQTDEWITDFQKAVLDFLNK